ncbi:hypothetical protein LG307_00070 [Sutcliffiella horikoshii]|uniref:hypothetical protein n=1 Tax=Sutcliffiella horikoshii TaxID=79883 RepID=UPI00384DF6C6
MTELWGKRASFVIVEAERCQTCWNRGSSVIVEVERCQTCWNRGSSVIVEAERCIVKVERRKNTRNGDNFVTV